jgi:HEAT repeat protein
MKKLAVSMVLLMAATAASALVAPEENLEVLLSGIDFVPGVEILDNATGQQTESRLLTIAESSDSDPGVRIRAIRALALYPSPTVATALDTLVTSSAQSQGLTTLYLRAAMDSLARVAGEGAVDTIAANLTHESRDVRAAAARALAVTGAASAVTILRNRLNSETEFMVHLAISEAIRVLTGEGTAGGE